MKSKLVDNKVLLLYIFVYTLFAATFIYNVPVRADQGSANKNGIFLGKVEDATKNNKDDIIKIDGTYYGLSTSLTSNETMYINTCSMLAAIADDSIDGNIERCKVIYKTNNVGDILKIARVIDVFDPNLTIYPDPCAAFTYSDGKFDQDYLDIRASLQCRYKADPFNPFTRTEISSISDNENCYIELSHAELLLNSEVLNFGNFGNMIAYDVSQTKTWKISVNEAKNLSYRVYLKKNYIPACAVCYENIGLKLEDCYGNNVFCNPIKIAINNLDIKEEQYNNKIKYDKSISDLNKALQAECVVSLDAYLMEYISLDQIKEIEKFISIYLSEIVIAGNLKTSTLFDSLNTSLKEKIGNAIAKKLGIDLKKDLVGLTRTGFEIGVEAVGKNGNLILIKISGQCKVYSLNNSNFAGDGELHYDILDASSVNVKSGTGMFTYADVHKFADIMMDYLKGAYNEAWGKKANDIAEMMIGDPISKFLSGTKFSDRIFNTSLRLAKGKDISDIIKADAEKDTKKFLKDTLKKQFSIFSIKCPVDVYLYDENNNVCGSIVNDQVIVSSQGLAITTYGDEKYFLLMGDEKYQMRIVSRENGTMNCYCYEYEDGELARVIEYLDVPLNENIEYSGTISGVHHCNTFHLYQNDSEEPIVPSLDTDNKITDLSIDNTEIITNGSFNQNVRYIVYSNGTMVIYGEGELPDCSASNTYGKFVGISKYLTVKHVIIEEGITSIGDFFFDIRDPFRSSIETITIPNSVVRIGDYAFWGNKLLRKINVGTGLSTLGKYAFSYCNVLSDITVAESNPYFSTENNILFSKNKDTLYRFPHDGTKEYHVPDPVNKIDYDAFGDVDSLETIYLPQGLVSAEKDSFDGCMGMKTVYAYKNGCTQYMEAQYDFDFVWVGKGAPISGDIADTIHWIMDGDTMFFSGTGTLQGSYYISVGENKSRAVYFEYKQYGPFVKEIVIEEGITCIEKGAFEEFKQVQSLKIPPSLTKIENFSFLDCPLSTVYTPSESSENTSDQMEWDIYAFHSSPEFTLYGYPGTYYETYAKRYSGIIFVSLLEYPNEIERYILEKGTCGDDLTWTLTSDGKLTISGTGEMYDFSYLTLTGYYTASAQRVPWAKNSARLIKDIIVEEGVTSIGNGAFCQVGYKEVIADQNYAVDSISFPNTLEKIGVEVFTGFGTVNNSIEIPDSVALIDKNAFWLSSLKIITVGVGIRSINKYCFQYSGINNIYFKGDAPTIQDNAFINRTLMAYYPRNNSSWTEDVMQGYGGNITWIPWDPYGVQLYEKTLTLPSNITMIESESFAGIVQGLNIVIPAAVSSIANDAFEGSSIVLITQSGSYAENWAKEHGVSYFSLESNSN